MPIQILQSSRDSLGPGPKRLTRHSCRTPGTGAGRRPPGATHQRPTTKPISTAGAITEFRININRLMAPSRCCPESIWTSSSKSRTNNSHHVYPFFAAGVMAILHRLFCKSAVELFRLALKVKQEMILLRSPSGSSSTLRPSPAVYNCKRRGDKACLDDDNDKEENASGRTSMS